MVHRAPLTSHTCTHIHTHRHFTVTHTHSQIPHTHMHTPTHTLTDNSQSHIHTQCKHSWISHVQTHSLTDTPQSHAHTHTHGYPTHPGTYPYTHIHRHTHTHPDLTLPTCYKVVQGLLVIFGISSPSVCNGPVHTRTTTRTLLEAPTCL